MELEWKRVSTTEREYVDFNHHGYLAVDSHLNEHNGEKFWAVSALIFDDCDDVLDDGKQACFDCPTITINSNIMFENIDEAKQYAEEKIFPMMLGLEPVQ